MDGAEADGHELRFAAAGEGLAVAPFEEETETDSLTVKSAPAPASMAWKNGQLDGAHLIARDRVIHAGAELRRSHAATL
jgi:hypothetical protein